MVNLSTNKFANILSKYGWEECGIYTMRKTGDYYVGTLIAEIYDIRVTIITNNGGREFDRKICEIYSEDLLIKFLDTLQLISNQSEL